MRNRLPKGRQFVKPSACSTFFLPSSKETVEILSETKSFDRLQHRRPLRKGRLWGLRFLAVLEYTFAQIPTRQKILNTASASSFELASTRSSVPERLIPLLPTPLIAFGPRSRTRPPTFVSGSQSPHRSLLSITQTWSRPLLPHSATCRLPFIPGLLALKQVCSPVILVNNRILSSLHARPPNENVSGRGPGWRRSGGVLCVPYLSRTHRRPPETLDNTLNSFLLFRSLIPHSPHPALPHHSLGG
ncbi:unnamed protein product [Tuber aestivum]|uniref:Uncharacterized protein n=1 Tax=Tuber aestivum TaxID=59557 RepID=A0A292Q748_9PEZI|nr:unnamed protein product [Tuber aestivum]